MDIEEFTAIIARPDPSIAGGNISARAGSFAAALGEKTAGLTEGRPAFAEHELRVREIHEELARARVALKELADEDSAAYGAVLNARRLPKSTGEEMAARAAAIEQATIGATETPLRNARAAFKVLKLLKILIEIGNPTARTDAAIGIQLAYASLKGAHYNVLANIGGIKDKAFAKSCRTESADLARQAAEILQQTDSIMEGS
jgi:formiminotetrahydrofolate cyclodeaminase